MCFEVAAAELSVHEMYEVISKTFVRHVERSQASITVLVMCV